MFRAIFTNSFGILFSRILGFLRDMLMASILGANLYSDIFFIAFKLPNLFRRIFAEGAFSQTFIPAFTRAKHKGVFSVAVFGIFFSIIFLLSVLVMFFPTTATTLIAIGFDQKTIAIASEFVAINFWYLLLIFCVSFMAALLQYKHHFATTAFATALLNISLIFALLLAKNKDADEIVYALSYGVLVGGVLQVIVHFYAIKRFGLLKILYGGVVYFPQKIKQIMPQIKKFQQEFLPAIWGNSSAQVSAFLDTWLASFLSVGSISYLYYANRIFQLPLALFAIATSVALFPKVSRYLKHNQEQQALQAMQKAFWFLGYLLVFSTIGGIVLADEIVVLLFQRGSFDTNASQHTALVLQMYMVGLVFFGISKLFLLWIYAKQQQKLAAKIASITLFSNVILSLIFLSPLGAAGLALASSISGIVQFVMSLYGFSKEHFFKIIYSKHSIYLLVSSIIFVIILQFLKPIIAAYI